jgi:hypothetical protein
MDTRPKISFYRVWHTPLIQSNSYEHEGGMITTDLLVKIGMKTSISLFENLILPETHKLFDGNGIDFNDILNAEPVPPENLFEFGDMAAYIAIGSPEKFSPKILSTLGFLEEQKE